MKRGKAASGVLSCVEANRLNPRILLAFGIDWPICVSHSMHPLKCLLMVVGLLRLG